VARALAEGAAPGPERWLVIGEVITARPTVRVKRSRDVGAQANLSFLQRVGQNLGLRVRAVRAEGSGDLRSAQLAEVVVAEPVPVAFHLAMVLVTPEIAEGNRAPSRRWSRSTPTTMHTALRWRGG
jgi:hypothetical protein